MNVDGMNVDGMNVDGMNVDGMNVDDRLYPAPAVESVDVGTETLVYDGQHLHLLRGAAASIWRLVDGQRSAAQIAAVMGTEVGTEAAARAAEANSEDVSRDVLNFLHQLTEQGLLSTADSGAGQRFSRPPHVGYVLDGDQVLIVDLRNGRRQALNATGARVWELTCRHSDSATVQRLLRAEFPDAPSTLESEVAALVDELCSAQLLVAEPDGPLARRRE